MRIALARTEDLPAIQAYLARRGDTCMFLRSNLAAAGLAYEGRSLQGEYQIAWDGDAVVGVAAHYWNGMLLVQADAAIAELATAVAHHSGCRVQGFSGAQEQVQAARTALGLDDAPTRIDHVETLMALDLAALVVPSPLAAGEIVVRQATATDRDPLVPWRAAYLVESNTEPDPAAARTLAEGWFDRNLAREPPWLATRDGEPAATSMFNARVPDTVQIGGVYTPPELRNRGHARAVVAGSLLDARGHGVTRSILFTPRPDAIAAYRALGYATVGTFAVVMFA